MRLADFIRHNVESIVDEWVAFAATRAPAAERMTLLSLRDHAEEILQAIVKDLDSPQTEAEQTAKSRGEAPQSVGSRETAAQTHGLLRAKSGFDINQMASEYRALRASVLRLWLVACAPQPPHAGDIIRFNEAIDQALAESVSFYSERVEQARNLFLGTLGHDMRTPLQAIHMTAAYLTQLNAGEAVTSAASRLMRSGGRMQSLLDNLVEFSRVNLGVGIHVDRRQADMAGLLADGIAQLRAVYPDRRIELTVHGSSVGTWDAISLQRLLDNLVVNAVKYGSRDTPVRVVVRDEGQDVVVDVRNEGVPIEASMLESLFDPLRRGLDRDEPEVARGSLGLGLYIAREIAKAHGGDIHARSGPDETVFSVRLPRHARDSGSG